MHPWGERPGRDAALGLLKGTGALQLQFAGDGGRRRGLEIEGVRVGWVQFLWLGGRGRCLQLGVGGGAAVRALLLPCLAPVLGAVRKQTGAAGAGVQFDHRGDGGRRCGERVFQGRAVRLLLPWLAAGGR